MNYESSFQSFLNSSPPREAHRQNKHATEPVSPNFFRLGVVTSPKSWQWTRRMISVVRIELARGPRYTISPLARKFRILISGPPFLGLVIKIDRTSKVEHE